MFYNCGSQCLKVLRNNYYKSVLNKNHYSTNRKLDSFSSTQNSLELTYKNESNELNKLNFHPTWLRFNCHDKTSLHEHTAQRILDLDKVPNKITIKNVKLCKSTNQLEIKWNEDSLVSLLPVDFLLENHPSFKSSRLYQKKFKYTKNLEKFEYSDLIKNGEKNMSEIKRWVGHIQSYGICVIKNVPIETNNCRKIAEIVAPIQPNLYGDVFEIINTPKPMNLALSNEKFMFHMDLPYLHDMPYIQFIQCLKFDSCVLGGESVYLNAVHAAEQFREKYPDHFKTLTEITPTFQRIHYERERPVHMVVKRNHIILNEDKEVEYVTWSPPNEGPLTNVTQAETDKYYEAYLNFAKFIEQHPDKIFYRMEPGDVFCFHNRKMLHSRLAFEMNGGIRHFQGCYINESEFKSQSFIYDLNITPTNTE